ncbi:MAG: threonine-phosphate decarboxylase [Desulfobacteraceae bacterium]|jgi:threonine-phosphate decarboxylase
MIIGHGGNIFDVAERLGCNPSDIIDMSSNLNPLGPPPGLVQHLKDNMDTIISLPEVNSKKITSMLADRYGIAHECVLAGNGTTQFIYSIPRALETQKALVVGPSYADYNDACAMHHADCQIFITKESDGFRPDPEELNKAVSKVDTVFICNPNNPTGVLWDNGELEELCRSHPETYFVIDESYLPFARDSYSESAINFKLPNVLVLNSMSKVFRIPGLRVGFLLAPVTMIYRFEPLILPWSVNALAQAAVEFVLENRTIVDEFLKETRVFVQHEKQVFLDSIASESRVACYPGSTYFVLAKLQEPFMATDLCNALLEQKILIRNCSNFTGLDARYVRFSLKDRETNMRLSHYLKQSWG